MTLLLLAGTGEARVLADRLAEEGVAALASLAGAVRAPKALPLRTRIGGFGGAEGFRAVLRDEGITAVIDATHPFADRITARSFALCRAAGIPFLRLERPGWAAEPGWITVGMEAAAAELAARAAPGAGVFLATGRQSMPQFAGLAGYRLFVRVVDPPVGPCPLSGGEWVVGRPPFDLASECALFERLGIDWLVVKDSGGRENRAKLEAARQRGAAVLMIRRPPAPEGMERVGEVEAALAWLRGRGFLP